MSESSSPGHHRPKKLKKGQVVIREHVYDGIQEYDQRLPNWWLFTLYGAIVFSFFYWFLMYNTGVQLSDDELMDLAIQRTTAAKLAAMEDINDEALWEMSRNARFVNEGQSLYTGNCDACHGGNLQGGIGLSLVADTWKYGGNPMDIYEIIANGSPDKASGMQAWLGTYSPQQISSIVAYILSHHEEATIQTEPDPTKKLPGTAGA